MNGAARPARGWTAHADLVAVVLLAGAAAGVAAAGVDVLPLRALLGVLLVVALPGYALVAMALPPGRLPLGDRPAFVVGVSLVISALVGLVLDLLPAGLTTNSWAIALGGVTALASVLALVRRIASPTLRQRPAGRRGRLTAAGIAAFAAAAVVIAGAVVLARVGAAQDDQRFTQLWILPAHGRARLIELGVEDREGSRQSYRLELTVDGTVVRTWDPLVLRDGQRWQTTVAAPVSLGPGRTRLLLFRDGRPGVYREVTLPVLSGLRG